MAEGEYLEAENSDGANNLGDEVTFEAVQQPESSERNRKNYAEIPNIALASIRYGVRLRPTAAIATAALIDA